MIDNMMDQLSDKKGKTYTTGQEEMCFQLQLCHNFCVLNQRMKLPACIRTTNLRIIIIKLNKILIEKVENI